MSASSLDALFVPDGNRWLPTDLSRGPWSPEALHGGAVAALVAREAEQCVPTGAAHSTRLTLELLRPVPIAPLELSAELVRRGRLVQAVDVSIRAEGNEVASGRVLRIRTLPLGDPGHRDPVEDHCDEGSSQAGDSDIPPGPDAGAPPDAPPLGSYRAFHNAGAELRFVSGKFEVLGPSAVWIRLAVPVVPAEIPSSMQRAAAAADFGNGVSAVLPFNQYRFVNPDLTVSIARPVVGEWVCLQAETQLGVPGVAVGESRLFDEMGRIGRSVQSLVVEYHNP